MLEKMWLVKKENIEKQGVFWNMMSSGLNSIVSMLLLWVVTRINGVADAGIFSLGFSTSQMMLTIGNYGMRNYQVTDINNRYSMRVYLGSRVVTNFLMMGVVAGFVLMEGYYLEKAVITVLLCLLKATDAFDDIYGGYYQKHGRLDISGKLMTLRIGVYIVSFCACLLLTHNLIVSCGIMCAVSAVVLIVLVASTRNSFKLELSSFGIKSMTALLGECLPLCISAFLLIYMSNAPKYAIDTYLTEEAQAYYTYLFMPCFVTNLFVGFALQPLLVRLSQSWIHKEYRRFVKLCGLIFAGAAGLAAVIVIGGSLVGCQVLSVVFGVELIQYKDVLIVLLIGGAFFAFAVIEQIILTVMRRQFFLLIGFAVASVTALLISHPFVQHWGLTGAGHAYTISAGVLFMTLGVMIAVFLGMEKQKRRMN